MADGAICIGIDLGTTYSCLSFIDETGTPVVAKNKMGDTTTPSVVYFEEGAEHSESVVGQVAKEAALLYPDRTVQLFKPRMGKEGAVVKTIDGDDITPTEASAHVLRKMALDYKERYGSDVEACVVTVPAHFGQLEREATIRAGKGAGLNVVGIVQEPVAAAVFYGACESKEDGAVLVYDLGGGTFDVTAISIKHADGAHKIDVVCAEGDHDLGGRLWDAKLVGYLSEEYAKVTGFDGEFTPYSKQQLRTSAEDAKKRLSETPSTVVTLVLDRGPAQVKLTREIFDDMTSNLLSNTISLTKKTMENAALKGCKVEKILLVGGSTRMPQVREALEENFPGLPIEMTDPDEAVAKGAAICAAMQMIESPGCSGSGDIGRARIPLALDGGRIEIALVTSKSYGLKVSRDDDTTEISNLILKNQKIDPSKHALEVKERFKTKHEKQTGVSLQVFESDLEAETVSMEDGAPIVSGDLDIGEFQLAKGSPIDVTFTLNEGGLLHIHAVEPSSGRAIDFEKEVGGLQTPEEIQGKVIGNGEIAR